MVRALGSVAALLLILAAGPAPATDRGPMSFHIARLQRPDCGLACPEVIIAEGIIETQTPAAFRDFAEREALAGRRNLAFLDSPGGNVAASMELGQEFRRLHLTAVVAGFAFSGGAGGGPVAGECESACVYALMGASTRVAPPMSRVALHRMFAPETGEGASAGYADSRFVAVLARYATRMGVNPQIVRMAESLSPGQMRPLSQREMGRAGLAASNF